MSYGTEICKVSTVTSNIEIEQNKEIEIKLKNAVDKIVLFHYTINRFAEMAELADAHGSGPCDSNVMRVQVPFPALKNKRAFGSLLF